MENMNTPQSMAYMWKLVDFDRSGKLDAFKINYFFRAVVKVLEDKDLDPVSLQGRGGLHRTLGGG